MRNSAGRGSTIFEGAEPLGDNRKRCTFCKTEAELKEEIERSGGGRVTGSVPSSKTDYLINNDAGSRVFEE